MLLFEHRSLQTSSRLRRCFFFGVLLYASLWLINLAPPWRGRSTSTWLRRVDDMRGCFAEVHATDPSDGLGAPGEAQATIGKVTMFYGDANLGYDLALASHEAHARKHGYPMFTLRRPLLNGIWSKLAYLLSVVSNELQKPEEQRLKWLFWFDADTYISNPNIKLETFLPRPDDAAFANVSLLISSDQRGPQAGVFYLRVDTWALELLTAAIALPRYRPDIALPYAEQTALECLTSPPTSTNDVLAPYARWADAEYFKRGRVRMPQAWTDAHVGTRLGDGTHLRDANGNPVLWSGFEEVQPGDLLVHFSGLPDKADRMLSFITEAEKHPEIWILEADKTELQEEADEFWQSWKKRHAASA